MYIYIYVYTHENVRETSCMMKCISKGTARGWKAHSVYWDPGPVPPPLHGVGWVGWGYVFCLILHCIPLFSKAPF